MAIQPDLHRALNNWGSGLAYLAKQTEDETLYRQSFAKYKQALAIQPDLHEALNNWVFALLSLADLKSAPEAGILLQQAKELAVKAKQFNSDNTYNLACVEIRLGNIEAAKTALLDCENNNTLPSRADLQDDTDLNSVRELKWFTDLLERAK